MNELDRPLAGPAGDAFERLDDGESQSQRRGGFALSRVAALTTVVGLVMLLAGLLALAMLLLMLGGEARGDRSRVDVSVFPMQFMQSWVIIGSRY